MRNKLEVFLTVAADKPELRMPDLYKTVQEVMNHYNLILNHENLVRARKIMITA